MRLAREDRLRADKKDSAVCEVAESEASMGAVGAEFMRVSVV